MEYRIKPNDKHESYTRTAFLEQIAGWQPGGITIIVTKHDMIDPNGPTTIDNFSIPSHHRLLVDSIVFDDGESRNYDVLYMRGVKE